MFDAPMYLMLQCVATKSTKGFVAPWSKNICICGLAKVSKSLQSAFANLHSKMVFDGWFVCDHVFVCAMHAAKSEDLFVVYARGRLCVRRSQQRSMTPSHIRDFDLGCGMHTSSIESDSSVMYAVTCLCAKRAQEHERTLARVRSYGTLVCRPSIFDARLDRLYSYVEIQNLFYGCFDVESITLLHLRESHVNHQDCMFDISAPL